MCWQSLCSLCRRPCHRQSSPQGHCSQTVWSVESLQQITSSTPPGGKFGSISPCTHSLPTFRVSWAQLTSLPAVLSGPVREVDAGGIVVTRAILHVDTRGGCRFTCSSNKVINSSPTNNQSAVSVSYSHLAMGVQNPQ